MKEKVYYSIDLKSFFASCECVNIGLNPYTSSIVIANPHQGNGAITLAITPYLKSLGVKSRCRLYEIPKHITYKIIKPNMALYKDYSNKVYEVYKEFVDEKDIHIYSIDECFIDITSYLTYYNKDEISLAKDILNKVKIKTGLSASCGIGPSIFLAKVAMDIEAKQSSSNIAYWTYEDIEKKLWNISNLQEVWKIGPSIHKNLNNLGIYNGYKLAKANPNLLKNKFGIIGLQIHNNFNGIYKETIDSLNKEPKDKTYSHSKYLLKDFEIKDINTIILKMSDKLENRLLKDNKIFETITCKLTFSNNIDFITKTFRINPSSNAIDIYNTFINMIQDINSDNLVRKIDIHLSKISDKKNKQLSLFNDNNNDQLSNTIYKIKNKYGYESIIKAANK